MDPVNGLLCRSLTQIPMRIQTLLTLSPARMLSRSHVCIPDPRRRRRRSPKRPGVTTPGVRIPITKLKPEAIYDVPGAPDWMAIDKEVWVSNSPKNTVSRLDPKSNVGDDVRRRQEPRAPGSPPASAASGSPTAATRRSPGSI